MSTSNNHHQLVSPCSTCTSTTSTCTCQAFQSVHVLHWLHETGVAASSPQPVNGLHVTLLIAWL